MRQFVRPLALLAVCGLAMLCTACGSSNKDKIVGKWKIESGPKMDAAKMAESKMSPYMEFTKDGTFKFGMEIGDAELREKMGKFAEMFTFTGKYTVNGDKLEVQPADGKDKDGPFKKENPATIKFEGNDKLILTGADGDMKLTRMK